MLGWSHADGRWDVTGTVNRVSQVSPSSISSIYRPKFLRWSHRYRRNQQCLAEYLCRTVCGDGGDADSCPEASCDETVDDVIGQKGSRPPWPRGGRLGLGGNPCQATSNKRWGRLLRGLVKGRQSNWGDVVSHTEYRSLSCSAKAAVRSCMESLGHDAQEDFSTPAPGRPWTKLIVELGSPPDPHLLAFICDDRGARRITATSCFEITRDPGTSPKDDGCLTQHTPYETFWTRDRS